MDQWVTGSGMATGRRMNCFMKLGIILEIQVCGGEYSRILSVEGKFSLFFTDTVIAESNRTRTLWKANNSLEFIPLVTVHFPNEVICIPRPRLADDESAKRHFHGVGTAPRLPRCHVKGKERPCSGCHSPCNLDTARPSRGRKLRQGNHFAPLSIVLSYKPAWPPTLPRFPLCQIH